MRIPPDGARSVNDLVEPDKELLRTFLEQARKFQIIDPFVYAEGHAVARGVPVVHADASQRDMEAWKEIVEEKGRVGRFLSLLSLDSVLTSDAEKYFRSCCAARDLGQAALKMVDGHRRSRPPRLASLTGRRHQRDYDRIFGAYQVPFTAHQTSPNYRARMLRFDARVWASFFVPLVPSQAQKNKKDWLGNLQAVQKEDPTGGAKS